MKPTVGGEGGGAETKRHRQSNHYRARVCRTEVVIVSLRTTFRIAISDSPARLSLLSPPR